MNEIEIKDSFLWMPVQTGAEICRLTVTHEGKTVYEFDIETAKERVDFYTWLDVRAYIGKTFVVSGVPAGWMETVEQHASPPAMCEDRPALHFTAHTGWINDPNGLLFDGKYYHLFFQHNPYGTQWGNMHWGHAVSRDLLHWTQLDEALYPDENGMMFSGCGFLDKNNASGFGKNTELFIYTAMGGKQDWAAHAQTTQRLAIAQQGSAQLKKTNVVCVPFIDQETRDPKVLYHAETSAYIMVLYIKDNNFGLFRSHDLKTWEQTQTLQLDNAWECPDLFRLKNKHGEDRWVFISADGFYYVGDFDGYQFSRRSQQRTAYLGTLPYAAQTWANVDGRILMTAWLRTADEGKPWRGMMSLPMELSLGEHEERLCLTPARELLSAREPALCMESTAPCDIQLDTKSAEIMLEIDENATDNVHLICRAVDICLDIKSGTCTVGSTSVNMRSSTFRVFLDYGIVEIFSVDDGGYYSLETPGFDQVGTLSVQSETSAKAWVWPMR